MFEKIKAFFSSPQPNLLIVIAVFSRLIPHPPNVTAVFGAAVFSGFAYQRRRNLAFVIPVISLFISDLLLGFHGYMIGTYIGALAATFVTQMIFSRAKNEATALATSRLGSAALVSSSVFFVISNFSVWIGTGSDSLYPKNWAGFLDCYVAAIPYFRNSILSDLISTLGIFAIYKAWVTLSRKNSYLSAAKAS